MGLDSTRLREEEVADHGDVVCSSCHCEDSVELDRPCDGWTGLME